MTHPPDKMSCFTCCNLEGGQCDVEPCDYNNRGAEMVETLETKTARLRRVLEETRGRGVTGPAAKTSR